MEEKFLCCDHICVNIASYLCGQCQRVFYCSEKCQKLDWYTHREKCFGTKTRSIISDKNFIGLDTEKLRKLYESEKMVDREYWKHHKFVRKLGRGSFSDIVLVEERKPQGREYALKIFKDMSFYATPFIAREYQIMNLVNEFCPESLKCFGLIQIPFVSELKIRYVDNYITALVLKHIDGKNLFDTGGIDNPRRFLEISISLIRQLECMHKHNILHNDISTSNVMIEERSDGFRVVFVDYGLSCFDPESPLEKNDKNEILVCEETMVTMYSSPEIKKTHTPSKENDIWSLGILFVASTIDQRTTFFPKRPLRSNRDFALTEWSWMSDRGQDGEIKKQIGDLVLRMLEINPKDRIKLGDLLMEFEKFLEIVNAF